MDFHSFDLSEYSFLLYKDEDLVSAKSLGENPEIDCSKVDFLGVNAYRNFDFIIQGDKYKDVIKQKNEFRELSCDLNEGMIYGKYDKCWGNLLTIKELDFKKLDLVNIEGTMRALKEASIEEASIIVDDFEGMDTSI